MRLYRGLYGMLGSYELMRLKWDFDIGSYHNLWVSPYMTDQLTDVAFLSRQLRQQRFVLGVLDNFRGLFQRIEAELARARRLPPQEPRHVLLRAREHRLPAEDRAAALAPGDARAGGAHLQHRAARRLRAARPGRRASPGRSRPSSRAPLASGRGARPELTLALVGRGHARGDRLPARRGAGRSRPSARARSARPSSSSGLASFAASRAAQRPRPRPRAARPAARAGGARVRERRRALRAARARGDRGDAMRALPRLAARRRLDPPAGRAHARALRARLHRAVLPQGQRRLRRAVRRAGGRARRARVGGARAHLGARRELPRLGADARRPRASSSWCARPGSGTTGKASLDRALRALLPPENTARAGARSTGSARSAPSWACRRRSRRIHAARIRSRSPSSSVAASRARRFVQPKRPSSRRSSPASRKRRNSAASGQGCAPAAPRPARSKSKPGPSPSQLEQQAEAVGARRLLHERGEGRDRAARRSSPAAPGAPARARGA